MTDVDPVYSEFACQGCSYFVDIKIAALLTSSAFLPDEPSIHASSAVSSGRLPLERCLTEADRTFWTSCGLPALAGWKLSSRRKSQLHAEGALHKSAIPLRIVLPSPRQRSSSHVAATPDARHKDFAVPSVACEGAASSGTGDFEKPTSFDTVVLLEAGSASHGERPALLSMPLETEKTRDAEDASAECGATSGELATDRIRQDSATNAGRKSLHELKTESLRKAFVARHELKIRQKDHLVAVLAAREISRIFATENKLLLLQAQKRSLVHSKLPATKGLAHVDVAALGVGREKRQKQLVAWYYAVLDAAAGCGDDFLTANPGGVRGALIISPEDARARGFGARAALLEVLRCLREEVQAGRSLTYETLAHMIYLLPLDAFTPTLARVILKAVQVLKNPLHQLSNLLRGLRQVHGVVPPELETEVVKLLTSGVSASSGPKAAARKRPTLPLDRV
ncbi:hypothetical protein BESB_062350 [Besnoitia besnoiti]|uniref:Uncharacterized protein n=1 Tax=Besnoitia besnoiti TaxID=94643 RepID=A0A2A9MA63_BESBE|nr:hypothetical protein BESB_062350 [Besnoitia besnoiti]PFH35348.1 hypothetical protein BESB_062350 [Besnoitia besnoiti]